MFNLGEYRRRATHMYKNHNFFRTDNEEAMALRERCAMDALDDVCDWLDNSGGEVAVSVASFYKLGNIYILIYIFFPCYHCLIHDLYGTYLLTVKYYKYDTKLPIHHTTLKLMFLQILLYMDLYRSTYAYELVSFLLTLDFKEYGQSIYFNWVLQQFFIAIDFGLMVSR